jgi:hypothetical protein
MPDLLACPLVEVILAEIRLARFDIAQLRLSLGLFPGPRIFRSEVNEKSVVSAQADLLAAIVRLTLPAGLGPFVEKLAALGGILDAAPSATAQASSSPRPSTP